MRLKTFVGITVVASLTLFLGGHARAQALEGAKPAPEQKQLEAWVGEWSYQGTQSETPMGPAGTFAGRQTARMILNGFFLETKWKDSGSYGGKQLTSEGLDLEWYDPLAKIYQDRTFENDGASASGTVTVSGSTWTSAGTRAASDGKLYRVKFTNVFSADGKTCATKAELSLDDGKSWKPWLELTMKKVGR